jgi:hypothetical protein
MTVVVPLNVVFVAFRGRDARTFGKRHRPIAKGNLLANSVRASTLQAIKSADNAASRNACIRHQRKPRRAEKRRLSTHFLRSQGFDNGPEIDSLLPWAASTISG